MYRCIDVSVYRCGSLVYWFIGSSVHRFVGTSWFIGVSVYWCRDLSGYLDVSVYRCIDVSVYRCFDVSVYWCLGVSVYRRGTFIFRLRIAMRPNPPGASRNVEFLVFPKLTSGPLGPLRGHLDLFGAHLGRVRGLGPGYAADDSAASAAAEGRTPCPGQAHLPSHPGTKYVAQGTLAATTAHPKSNIWRYQAMRIIFCVSKIHLA